MIVVGIPFTVYIAQKQQEIRQRAAERDLPFRGGTPQVYLCPENTHPNFYCQPGGCNAGDTDLTSRYNCANGANCCYRSVSLTITSAPPRATLPPTRTPTSMLTLTPTVTITLTPSPSPSPTVTPTTTVTVSPPPSPTCEVPPHGCEVPNNPRCLRPIPPGGWCQVSPSPSVSPSVSPSILPSVSPSISPSPSVTIPPGVTSIEVDLKLQGIGKTGAENDNPKTATRTVTVEIFNSSGTTLQSLVGTLTGNVEYNTTTGTFKGIFPLPEITTGYYGVKVSTPKYLKKLIGRDTNYPAQRIVVRQNNQMELTTLIIGDVNGDNRLSIMDWWIWTACFKKTMTTPVPLEGIQANCGITDLNDDGEVDHTSGSLNMRDYQWLFKSFQVQTGD